MKTAAVGSCAKLERTYVDEDAGQTICFWAAPDRKTIEGIFQKAGVKPETVRQVKLHKTLKT